MSDFVFNGAKGRVVELYNHVDTNVPAGCKLVVMAVNRGAATDATLKDYATFATLIADADLAEVTNGGYARKTLTGASLAAIAADTANDRFDVDIPDQTFLAVAVGTAWTDVVTGYDPLGTGVDANIIPLTCHAFAQTPDGSAITVEIAAAGFFRAN